MPGKNFIFTTRVDPVSPPHQESVNISLLVVEAPGTAPGSASLIPQSVYRHSWKTSEISIT